MVAPVLPSRWVIAPADAVDDPDVYPFLIGQGFLQQKNPMWMTNTSVSVSGVDRARALWSYPKWHFQLNYEVLRDAAANLELQRLVTFFNAHFGSTQAFFYLDRDDNTVATAMQFATGDGSTKTFQITRTVSIGSLTFTEPVRGFNGAPVIYVNGTPTAVTVNALGTVTFATAPASGAVISWTGRFFYLCRFTMDTLDLTKLGQGFWATGSAVEFQTVKM